MQSAIPNLTERHIQFRKGVMFKDLVMAQREVRQDRSSISMANDPAALQSNAEVVELLREIRDLLKK